jgi:hypothetical protein
VTSPGTVLVICCVGIRGNVNGDIFEEVNVADLTYLVGHLFQSGSPPPCSAEGNADGIVGIGGPIDIADVVYLVEFLFLGGPPPVPCS